MNSLNDAVLIDGKLDTDYLQRALARAGRTLNADTVELEKLEGGRTGGQVHRLKAGNTAYVVKCAPINSWQQEGMNSQGEGPIWCSGFLNNLPYPLDTPFIDAAYHEGTAAWWLLMDDVSSGIRPRGAFGEDETLVLWRALARLHARYWGESEALGVLPIVDVAATTKIMAEPVLCASGRETRSDWVKRVVEEFMPLNFLLPRFLELISPNDADFYLEMCKNRAWHKGLDSATPTLLHGDLRRANISYHDDKVALFDWEFSARGPAACDLQWNAFLTFWAYTPNDGRMPWERDHLKEAYLEELKSQLGGPIDLAEFQKTWDLAWVRIISTLGFCFADVDLENSDERSAAAARASNGIRMCRVAVER